MNATDGWLRGYVRDFTDFPEPGIVFKDITPLLADVDAFRFCIDELVAHFKGDGIDQVAGVEARGFLVASAVAYRFGAGLIPVRKPGKLPGPTVEYEYELEYGTDKLQVHADACHPGGRVLLIDDVLATGGTAVAATELIEGTGAEVVGLGFLLELGFLGGKAHLGSREVRSLLVYD